MPRSARIVIPGAPHHVTHRGNNREVLFRDDADFSLHLRLFRSYARKHNLSVLAYCLMPTHTHYAVIPKEDISLARGVGFAHLRYAQLFNARYHRTGHLWEGRYFSCVMDEPHLSRALCYIERNPVRAGLVRDAWEYPWSSTQAHLSGHDPLHILDMDWWHTEFAPLFWREQLARDEEEGFLMKIREATFSGRCLDK